MPPKTIGDPAVLQRKPPPGHSRYDAARPVVDSGGNVLKLAEVLGQKPAKDEAFRRMRCATLQRLLAEETPEVRVVLLDVRPADEYEACHLDQAESWPASMLSRTVNPFSASMFHGKNQPGVCLVLYDYEEKIVAPTARTLFERGFDNVVVLTGGLQRWVEEGLPGLVGTPPALPRPRPGSIGGSQRAPMSSTASSCPSSSTLRSSTVSSLKPKKPAPFSPEDRWK
jgi:centrosomal protein CEP41